MPEELDPEVGALVAEVFELARHGETDQLAALVDAGLPVDLTNESGDTPLILAAYHGHPGTVRMLVDRGADTGRVNDRGQTALGAAAFRRSVPAVKALLAAGADPALGSPSALDVARRFNLPDMSALLQGDPRLADALAVLDAAEVVVVVDWPSRDVPETLARTGFAVVVQGGPRPEDTSIYQVVGDEVVARRLGRPPERADVLYAYRPVGELPRLVAWAQALGATAVWLQSGLAPGGARDPRGCWLPADDLRRAREIVESAGLTLVTEPPIVEVAGALGP